MKKANYNVIDYIKSDCFRYTAKDDLKNIIKLYITNSTFRWQVAFRMCNSVGRGIRLAGNILWRANRTKRKILIPKHTKVGYGLIIAHGGPVVINGTAIIGNNFGVSQFTTIGANNGKAAIIGDNVYIDPNVCIVEDIHIGNNVTVGAGSVVTKDIPDNATIAGNYAKVLNYNNPGRYVINFWNTERRDDG